MTTTVFPLSALRYNSCRSLSWCIACVSSCVKLAWALLWFLKASMAFTLISVFAPSDNGCIARSIPMAISTFGISFGVTEKFSPFVNRDNSLSDSSFAIGIERAIQPLSEGAKTEIRVKAIDAFKNQSKAQANLTQEETQAMHQLKERQLLYLKADKGNTVVVMKKEQYEAKMDQRLEDQAYVKIKNDPTNRVIKRLKHFAEAAGIQTYLIPTVAIPPRI